LAELRLAVGSRLTVGDSVLLEVTQIGKECHSGCAIMRQVGSCVMPKEGVFAKVITGGTARPGDQVALA
jgi:MOSC domain-containing protein YiiM